MTTIDPRDDVMTLINTFTVDPDRADELFTTLSEATQNVLRTMPGFVSANLHISDDRRHVTNYAQWRTREDYSATLKNPVAGEHMSRAADIAESFEPIIYTLRESIVTDKPG